MLIKFGSDCKIWKKNLYILHKDYQKWEKMSSNLAATTKLKVSQLYQQSLIRLIDKRNMFFIGDKNGIHIYDIGTGKI